MIRSLPGALRSARSSPSPPATRKPLSPPPPRPSSPSAHAGASAAPSASPAASSGSRAPSNSPFFFVARSPDAFELYPLKGALFVDAAGFLALLDEGPLRQSPSIMRGLEKGQSGRVLGGFPDGAWLAAGQETYRWSGDRWVGAPMLQPEAEKLLDLAAWGEKGAIAAIAMPGNDMRLAAFGGRSLATPSPAEAPSAAQPAEGEEGACKARMKPDGVLLAGLPGEEIYAVGHACEAGGRGGAIVERWAAKQAQGTVDALPEPESGHVPTLHGVLARSPGEVIVYGAEGVPAAPYLARFDGKAWSLEHARFGGGVDTLAAADDGTLWAAAGGAVWKKAGARAWEKVPLPADLAVHAVWPRTATDVWAVGREHEGKARAVLLRTGGGEGRETIRLPPRNAMAGTIASSGRFFATAACDKVFVSLYVLGPSRDAKGQPAAIPKDFGALKPVLVGELSGLAPVVEDDGAELHVGVVAPSREVGRKLVTAYLEQHPEHEKGPAPSVFCHEPAIVKQAIKLP